MFILPIKLARNLSRADQFSLNSIERHGRKMTNRARKYIKHVQIKQTHTAMKQYS